MSQPAGIEPNGQGQPQGPVNINGDQGGTAGQSQPPIQYGDFQQQQQGYQQQPYQQQQGQGGQPPYAQYLERIPQSLRGAVEPIFKEWDANYTRTTQQYADRLKQLEPYQQFQGYDPQAMNAAIQLAQMVQNDPEQVFQLLADQLEYDLEDDDDDDIYGQQQAPYGQQQEDPRINSIEQALSDLTEMIQGDREQQQEDRETENILSYLQDVEQQQGPIDYDFVLSKAYATGDLDAALDEWYEKYSQPGNQQQQVNGQQQQTVTVGGLQVPANHPALNNHYPNQQPPQPLASGGGLPSDTQDLSKLDSKSRASLVAQVINAANQQSQG